MTPDDPATTVNAPTEPGRTQTPAGRVPVGRHREHLSPARPRRVAPTFTAHEYAILAEAAAQVGLTPTGFCARAALTVAVSGRTPTGGPHTDRRGEQAAGLSELQAELAEARVAVVRVGTNLNQAVRALHATGEAPVWLAHVVELCGRALTAVNAAASAVHRRLR